MSAVDLSVGLGPLPLANPVLAASGCFGFGPEYARVVDASRLGAVVMKTLTLDPRAGNPPPRIAETVGGALNAIGLENPGIAAFKSGMLEAIRDLGCPVIASIAGNSEDEYAELARELDLDEIAAVEINVSCPNVKEGGLAFGVSAEATGRVVAAVRKATGKPVLAKLSPNVTDIGKIARAAESSGADAVSLINTLLGLVVDWRRQKPFLGFGTGGLSGPCVKPVALRMVREVARAVKVPVVGIGGIRTADDAMEFLVAGASAVQVGTANFADPAAAFHVLDGLAERIELLGASSAREIVDTLKMKE